MKCLAMIAISFLTYFAQAMDPCEEFQQRLGNDKQVRCNLTGMLRRGDGRNLQVNCDDPAGSDRDLVGYIDQTQSISSIREIRLKLFDGKTEIGNAPELTTKPGGPAIEKFSSLPARRLCPKGTENSLSCDDLKEKIPALNLLAEYTKGLTANQIRELKRGTFNGYNLQGFWITFSLPLSEISSCSYE
jgi:hypothetical protein